LAPRVTVLMPTYDGARYVREALETALSPAQGFDGLEVVVVDDASTDGTPDIVEGIAAADPRVRLFRNEKNLGIVGNWNRCCELARAPYLIFLHQDDRHLPGIYARTAAVLDREPAVRYVHVRTRLIDGEGRVTSEAWLDDERHRRDFVAGAGDYFPTAAAKDPVLMPGALFRRETFERAGPFSTRFAFAPDYFFWLRGLLEGPIAYLAEPLAEYRFHATQLSARFQKAVAREERIRAAALALDEGVARGLIPPAAAREARAHLARRSLKAARACAREQPDLARTLLRRAYEMRPLSRLSVEALVARTRLAFARRKEAGAT